jgi:CRP/FNR family cyclic AMP-dependent transcriptional regulator
MMAAAQHPRHAAAHHQPELRGRGDAGMLPHRYGSPKLQLMPPARYPHHNNTQAEAPQLDTLALSPALRALIARVEPHYYRKDTILIHEGDVGDTLYVVLSGRVRAFSRGSNDREITFGISGPGDYVGEMALDGGKRSASVITLESTACAVVTRQTLLAHVAQYPEFAFELLALVIRRARLATSTARQMALDDVYGRLKSYLESSAVKTDEGMLLIRERVTQEEIGFRLGCSRGMVARLMKDLERGGYIAHQPAGLALLRPLPSKW